MVHSRFEGKFQSLKIEVITRKLEKNLFKISLEREQKKMKTLLKKDMKPR